MLVSEAETKVCPFMSNHVNDGMDTIFAEQNCITNECIAWENIRIPEPILPPQEIENADELPEDEKYGFCQRLRK